MKQVIRIALFLLVLYLNFKPLTDFIEQFRVSSACCENTCHREQNTQDVPNPFQTNKCFGKNCNPFQYCSACSLMAKTAEIKLVPQRIAATVEVAVRCNPSQNFISKLYQPPKV